MLYKSNGKILQREKISLSVMKMLSIWKENDLKTSISDPNPIILLSHAAAVLVFGSYIFFFHEKSVVLIAI